MKNIIALIFCTLLVSTFMTAQITADKTSATPNTSDQSTTDHESTIAESEMTRVTAVNKFVYSQQNDYNSNLYELAEKKENFYVFKKWTFMKAAGKDGVTLEVDSANYMIEKKKILFYKEQEVFEVFPNTVDQIILGDKLFKPYQDLEVKDDEDKNVFYEVIVAGDLELLRVWDVTRDPVSDNPMGIVVDKHKIRINKSSKLYYFDTNKSRYGVQKLPRKKSGVLDIFGSKKNKLVKYVADQKLSLRKSSDLDQIFTYYNSLD